MGILMTESSTMSSAFLWIWIILLFVMMYFIMIRPQRKEEKKKAALLSALAVGDSVRTTGGFYGVVVDINEDVVIVEFGNNRNCRIPMIKEAIVEVEKPEDAVKPVETKADKKKEK